MKLSTFRDFKWYSDSTLLDVVQYLSVEVTAAFRELRNGLARLTFAENFESFEVTLQIAANSEIEIRNQLKNGIVPSRWIAVRKNQAANSVADGETKWSKDFVYLKNFHSTARAELTVIFFR